MSQKKIALHSAVPTKESRKRKLKRFITAALVVILIIIIILLLLRQCDSWFDANARRGSYVGKSYEQIVADLNREVDESMMNVSICSVIRFPYGSTEDGNARIENIQGNHVDQTVSLILSDTGKVVYQSKAIAPGYAIDNIQLNTDLNPGTYEATAIFTGYDCDTHEETGQLGAEVQLVVS